MSSVLFVSFIMWPSKMKNPISSGLLDYLQSLDPMIVFLIVIIIIIAVTEKF